MAVTTRKLGSGTLRTKRTNPSLVTILGRQTPLPSGLRIRARRRNGTLTTLLPKENWFGAVIPDNVKTSETTTKHKTHTFRTDEYSFCKKGQILRIMSEKMVRTSISHQGLHGTRYSVHDLHRDKFCQTEAVCAKFRLIHTMPVTARTVSLVVL